MSDGNGVNPQRRRTRRPYRDAALAYSGLGVLVIVVVIGLVTGGGLARALVIGVVFFALATGWSWWRFRSRIEHKDRR